MKDDPTTFHAPASRSDASALATQSALFSGDIPLTKLLRHIPAGVFLLNANREIVFINHTAMTMAGPKDYASLLGLRPGEFVGCVHSSSDAGCGTTRACRYCGAVKAILQSQAGSSGVEECHILLGAAQEHRALDLRVWTTPVELHGSTFVLLAFLDIQDEKRRSQLEQVFLHDIRNTSRVHYLRNVHVLSDQILEEIQAQKILLAAENGQLELEPVPVAALSLAREVLAAYNRPDLTDGRNLALDDASLDAHLVSDPALLKRVLGNMVKNAIEASVPGETVRVGCGPSGAEVRFWVQNPTYMPENIRLQVFNRSFSTKGTGRGLGTYSMKLLTDHYLKGRIEFTSSEAAGTRFTATYPASLAGAGARGADA
jgi:hypothetical protein